MKKVLAFLLSLLMVFSVLPLSALANDLMTQEKMTITEPENKTSDIQDEESQELSEQKYMAIQQELPESQEIQPQQLIVKDNSALLPQSSVVDGQGATSGKCGLNLTWSYNTTTCVLTISGKGDMYDYGYKSEYRSGSYYYYSTAPWGYNYGNKIKSVIISDNVTSIGVYAFYNCSNLTSVTISNGITSIDDWAFYYCSSLTSLTIPDSVTNIGTGAFYYCSSLTSLIIPMNVTSIGARAFYNCRSLELLTIPNSVITIGDYAFYGCSYLNYSVYNDGKYLGNTDNPYLYLAGATSTAINGITTNENTRFIGDEAFYNCSSLTSVTISDAVTSIGIDSFSNCTMLASVTIGYDMTTIGKYAFYNCNNLNTVYYDGDLSRWNNISIGDKNESLTQANRIYTCHHTYGKWSVVQKDNRFVKVRICSLCQAEDEIEIFRYETENYNVCITNASNISSIRYAPGVYETPSIIKRADGCYTISIGKITANTVDGDFIYEMPDGGVYSFSVKLNDGSEYVFKAELNYFTQELSSIDNNLTVSNLYGVSDIFFCVGHYDNYNDVKDNNIYRVTSAKINGAKKYTYPMPAVGEVTVYVKYTDANRAGEFLYTTLTAPNPTITQNGLDMTIDNLTDVKCIRRAYGTYTDLAAIKNAEAVVTYNGKELTGGADSAKLHVPREGTVTVCIQYRSGYTTLKTIEVVQKRPTFEQNGNSVTIGDIDDLYVIRYAKGTYTKSNAVKNAPGCEIVRSSAAVDGQITIEDLTPGTYTFLVQYNDQSQNFYTITVQ